MTARAGLRGLLAIVAAVASLLLAAAVPAASADGSTSPTGTGATQTGTGTSSSGSGGCLAVVYQDQTFQDLPGLTVTPDEPLPAIRTAAAAAEATDDIAPAEPVSQIAGVEPCPATTATTTTTTTDPATSGTAPSATAPTTSTSTTPPGSSTPATPPAPTTPTTTTPTTTSPTTTSPTKPGRRGATPSAGTTPPAEPGSPTSERSGSKAPPAAARKRTRRPPRAHRRKPRPSTGAGGSKTTRKLPTGKGVPSAKNPTLSVSLPGAPAVGVPNFFIDSFQIPPFLLPIYQAAGIEYQVPWQVLAAINWIETDYGRNLSVSSAGAVGWMQFLPSTWRQWGVDATGDGVADPYNPVDAIFSAARYLHAAGASQNLSKAIYAYNHASWYVQSVLLRAKLIGGTPSSLVGALTGLVEGHFPVAAPAKYADDSVVSLARHRVKGSDAAITISSDRSTGTAIFADRGSPVIAVNDGKVVRLGSNARLGNFVELQDSTGNIYTYSHLGSLSKRYPVPKPVQITRADRATELRATRGKRPSSAPTASDPKIGAGAATAGYQPSAAASKHGSGAPAPSAPSGASTAGGGAGGGSGGGGAVRTPLVKERLFAHPARAASFAAGGKSQLSDSPQISSFDDYFADTLHLAKDQYTLQTLKVGSIVVAGTILGRIGGPSQGVSSHLYFQIQPAGRDAPEIDPKPILDGWKLLQATAVYRANGVDPFYGRGARSPTVGQVLLMSKQQLQQRVLTDPHVQIYACGRRDIEVGTVDRRVLAVIEFLSASGLDPYVSGLSCDASENGTTGVDAAGRTGESVDISEINGIPVAGHTGPGSITDQTIRRLLTLQGSIAPDQIISAISYKDAPSTLALPNHRNRIQITFTPRYGKNGKRSKQLGSILEPSQWRRLIDRIGQIPEPVVPIAPSRYSIRTPPR